MTCNMYYDFLIFYHHNLSYLNSMSSRVLWLDIAKGITIILMVIGHTSIPMSLSNFIWSFHMPLFFIASGWMTDWQKYSVGNFVIKKTPSILLPFAIYSIVVLIVKYLALGGGIWKNGCRKDGWGMHYGLYRYYMQLQY